MYRTDEGYPGVYFYGDVLVEQGVTIFPGAHIGRPPRATGSIHQKPKAGKTTYLGPGTIVGANAVLYQGVQTGSRVLIGDGATIREDTVVDDDAIVGSNATIQNDVWIGKRSRVLDLSHITAHVKIGDDVFISVGVLTMNDNSMAQGGELNPPSIERNARVGGGAALLPGTHVGENALVATGAVVTHDVGENVRVQGVPARVYGQPVAETEKQIWDAYLDRIMGDVAHQARVP